MQTQISDKLLKKLQKLHALANCRTGNVHECAAAAARMTEIMLEHGIASLDFQEMVLDRTLISTKKMPAWQQTLMGNLAKAVGCRAVISAARGAAQQFWIVGSGDLLKTVQYQFHAIIRDLERMQKLTIGAPKRSAAYTSFCWGAVHTIVLRIQEKRESLLRKARVDAHYAGTSQKLAKLERGVSDSDVADAFNLASDTKIQDARPRQVTINKRDAYYEGRLAGRVVALDSGGAAALQGEKRGLPCES